MVAVGGKCHKTYLKIRIHILGSGMSERALRAFIFTKDQHRSCLGAEALRDLWRLVRGVVGVGAGVGCVLNLLIS